MRGHFSEFVLENDDVFIAETRDNVDFGTGLEKGFGRRIGDRAADTAADDADLLKSLDRCRFS